MTRSTAPNSAYDAVAATEEILERTYDKQVAATNSIREQMSHNANLSTGWVDQLLSLLKMLITLSVTAIIGGLTVSTPNLNSLLLVKVGFIVLICSIISVALCIYQKMRITNSYLEAATVSTKTLTELQETLRLFNQSIDLKHTKRLEKK